MASRGQVLKVEGKRIVNAAGETVRLRGAGLGGWMNMENFINGYPGDEKGIRAAVAEALGADKGQFFFDRWLDAFFAEEDVAMIAQSGADRKSTRLNSSHSC